MICGSFFAYGESTYMPKTHLKEQKIGHIGRNNSYMPKNAPKSAKKWAYRKKQELYAQKRTEKRKKLGI